MAQKIQLTYKKRDIWPRTSIDNVVDPKTGKPIDLSKIISTNPDVAPTYKINGVSADANGNFTLTPESIGAATSDHTHTLASLNAASAVHTHTLASLNAASANHTHSAAEVGAAAIGHHHSITDIDGLDARLAGIDTSTEAVEGGFAMSALNNNTYPEPSTWTSTHN